jgi:squalene-associated FAD-dependent desaturase
MAAGRVAVIGAGLAGLAAAVALSDAGCAVDIFERSRLLGGRATSFVLDGVEVDNGQHVFLTCCTSFIAFLARLDMDRHMYLQPRFEAVVFAPDGRRCDLRAVDAPAPLHLLPAVLRYRFLSPAGRLRLVLALMAARTARPAEGQPFAAWLAAHGQGDDALRAFWRPFFVPALNAPLEEAPLRDALFVLRTAFLHDRSAARFGYSRVPLARVAQAAAARVRRVHTETPVRAILEGPRGCAAGIELDSGERLAYDGVCIATPPQQAARLLRSIAARAADRIGCYASRPIVDVHLWHSAAGLGFDFAALVDSPVQWIFQKAPGYLVCSISDALDFVGRPRDELVALCWDAVHAALPGLRTARLLRGAATRVVEATFAPAAGQPRATASTDIPNIVLAGSWTDTGWPDTMESAVRSGYQAARILREHLSAGADPGTNSVLPVGEVQRV